MDIPPPQTQPPLPTRTTPTPEDDMPDHIRVRWAREVVFLHGFDRASWGTAYRTIAEIQLLLRIGQAYGMTPNLSSHSVTTGVDGESGLDIEIQRIGSWLNGQAFRTWTNKLTFFFAIHDFLRQTDDVTVADNLSADLSEARQAMLSWGVGLEVPDTFLPVGDNRARFKLSPLHKLIRDYMVSQLLILPYVNH